MFVCVLELYKSMCCVYVCVLCVCVCVVCMCACGFIFFLRHTDDNDNISWGSMKCMDVFEMQSIPIINLFPHSCRSSVGTYCPSHLSFTCLNRIIHWKKHTYLYFGNFLTLSFFLILQSRINTIIKKYFYRW